MKQVFIAAVAFAFLVLGCLDSLHDYSECKEIEFARCELRRDCQDEGNGDFKKEFKDFDYDTCIAYSEEHCRTRKIGGGDEEIYGKWNGKNVDRCVKAINDLFPGHCKDLDRSVDETEWEFMEETCWFINELEEEEEEEEEPEDAGLDSGSGDDVDNDKDAG
ncbi:MAG: hypothetical protein GY847_26535 [Proteobacteria bacterium]|nr:hypothetical protein [Pseudomonadota bacterium]